MKLLRFALVGCLVLGLAGCSSSNKDKIVGTWEITKAEGEMPVGATVEFTKDGKMKVTAEAAGMKISLDGTYSVDGDKLAVTMKGPDGKEKKETDTITKLTDKEMELKDPQGKTATFKKK